MLETKKGHWILITGMTFMLLSPALNVGPLLGFLFGLAVGWFLATVSEAKRNLFR